jgi:hypothetical protein
MQGFIMINLPQSCILCAHTATAVGYGFTEKHNKLRDKKHKDADAAFHKAQNEEDKMNREYLTQLPAR